MIATSPAGVVRSLSAVEPRRSQNSTVITRRSPPAAASSGRSIRPCTMRGSMYLPKISLIHALTLSSATMALKARSKARSHRAPLAVAGIDVEAPDVEAPLERADVRARQRGVALDVAVPQDLELAAHAR